MGFDFRLYDKVTISKGYDDFLYLSGTVGLEYSLCTY